MKGKIGSVLLACMTIAALLEACQSGDGNAGDAGKQTAPVDANFNATGFPIVKNKVTMSMMGITSPTLGDWKDNAFFKRMEDLTNVHFTFTTIPNDTWDEKKNITFATNDLPDVFFKASFTPEEEMRYGGQGVLIPLEKLIDQYAPNLKKLLQEHPDIKKSITLPSGHIVALPKVGAPNATIDLYINKKWLDAVGMKEPTTSDEFYQVLKAFKEKDPTGKGDEIPLSFSYQAGAVNGYNQSIRYLMAEFGLLPNAQTGMFVNDANKVVYAFMQPEYKSFLVFMRKLYSEKLLDNDCFSQNNQQLRAKGTGSSNRLGSFITSTPLSDVGLERSFDYEALVPFKNSTGKQVWFQDVWIARGKFAITNANKNPEAAIRWVDYLYSEEGKRLLWMGKEGEDYKINSDGSWDWTVPNGENRGKISMQPGGNEVGGQPDLWNQTTDKSEQFLIKERAKVQPFAKLEYPLIYLDDATQTRANAINADLYGYANQMMAKFITGETSIDGEWDKYVSTLKQMGVDDLVNIYEKAYQDYAKKN